VISMSAKRLLKLKKFQYSFGRLVITNNHRKLFYPLPLLFSLISLIGHLQNVEWMQNTLPTVFHGEGGIMSGNIVCNRGVLGRDRERRS
jgi:hypothetical protein